MKQQSFSWWRPWVAGIFIAVATVALVGAVLTRYVQRNLLDSQGYLAVVGPLPGAPKVADALAKFTTETTFNAADAEASLKEFLPPRLEALSGPLSERLEDRTRQAAKEFVQSDAFNSIWIGSNDLLRRGVVRLAESKQGEGELAAAGQLDLSQLTTVVSQRLGQEPPSSGQLERATTIQINLRQRVERLRATYSAVNTGAYILPYVASAFLLAALAVAYDRRRVVMAVGITLLLLGVAGLLAFKIVSGDILSEITDAAYKSAAEVVYEAFYSDLRGRLIAITGVGGLLILLALLAGPYKWAKWTRKKIVIGKLKNVEPYRWAVHTRQLAARYEPWVLLAGAAVVIIWLLALSTLTPATLVVILSILITYISLIHLIAQPAPAQALV